ncbi:methyltransferase-domain-containing protein [Hypoxylon sp. FL1284]|nr:methyltransferase-domain-containing protein [Hypoxylon sp. FL1284]
MFAVPGWAVSADSLKPETARPASKATQDEPDNSKKRKRPSSTHNNVTTSNVADLWEQVIEGRSGKKAKSAKDQDGAEKRNGTSEGRPKKMTLKEKKKLKKLREKEGNEQNGAEKSEPTGGINKTTTTTTTAAASESHDTAPGKESKKDKKKKAKERKEKDKSKNSQGEEAGDAVTAATTTKPPAGPKLTPLQAQMREKLVSARFRHLNETLYTKPSADAFQLFADAPEMFGEYHEGFRRQVDVWPENPVDGYIRDIQARGRQRTPSNKPSKHDRANSSSSATSPLPRTAGTCTIADLGCGDAKLSAALQPDARKLRLSLLSYDLRSAGPLVTAADVAALPLADGAVDVAVFCLALMGTNWPDFVDEAYRVLRWKGELWVAEIKSRFGPSAAHKKKGPASNAPVAHSVGNRRKAAAGGKKKAKERDAADAEADEAELAVEVDGADDDEARRGETDVSAFVDALRRRGFVLQGEPDLRNKMFVKMRFLKAAPPSVGKNVAAATVAGGPRKNGGVRKFIENSAEESQDAVDEASILKPCVYKLR